MDNIPDWLKESYYEIYGLIEETVSYENEERVWIQYKSIDVYVEDTISDFYMEYIS